MTTTTTFRFKVFGIASLLASSILVVILVAQRPDVSSGTSVVETGGTLAHANR